MMVFDCYLINGLLTYLLKQTVESNTRAVLYWSLVSIMFSICWRLFPEASSTWNDLQRSLKVIEGSTGHTRFPVNVKIQILLCPNFHRIWEWRKQL